MSKGVEQLGHTDYTQPDTGRTGRRQFLKTVTASAAALFAGSAFGQEEQQQEVTDVNEYARNYPMPDELKNIDYMTQDLRMNAKHLLVHLPIIHWHDDYTSEENIHEVAVCQTQWKEALESMIAHPYIKLKTLYTEGKCEEKLERRYSTAADAQRIIDERRTAEEPKKEATPAAEEKNWEHIPSLVRMGADYELEKEKKLTLQAIEWPDTNALGYEANRADWPDAYEYMFDKRERAALEIITTARVSVAHVFYGSLHKWKRQITVWNKAHPDEIFSLMTLVPDCMFCNKTGQRVPFEEPSQPTATAQK